MCIFQVFGPEMIVTRAAGVAEQSTLVSLPLRNFKGAVLAWTISGGTSDFAVTSPCNCGSLECSGASRCTGTSLEATMRLWDDCIALYVSTLLKLSLACWATSG